MCCSPPSGAGDVLPAGRSPRSPEAALCSPLCHSPTGRTHLPEGREGSALENGHLRPRTVTPNTGPRLPDHRLCGQAWRCLVGKSQPPAMKQSKIRLGDCSAYTLFVSRHKRGYLKLNIIFSKQLNLIKSGEKKNTENVFCSNNL